MNGALKSYNRYLAIAQESYDANPNDAAARRSVALALETVGDTMAQAGDIDDGLVKLNRARSYYEQTVSATPTLLARRDLATVDLRIGDILAASGRNDGAVASFQRSLAVTEKLADEDPKDTVHKRDLHQVLVRLAKALYKAGNHAQARQATVRVKDLLSQLLSGPEQARDELEQYCELLLTTPFKDLRDPVLARRYADQLVEMTKGKDAYTLDLLAQAKDVTGDILGAVQTEKRALELVPANSNSELKAQLDKNLAGFQARAKRKQTQ